MFVIEPTEPRFMLSAVQTGTIVTIHGTPANDVIQLWSNASDLIVRENGAETAFSLDGLKLARIYGEHGDDTITALPGTKPLTIRLSIDGGAGNDSITGGAGNDTMIGDLGNDTMIGGGGNDFVDYRYIDIQSIWHIPIRGDTINLATGQVINSFGDVDTISGIHGVLGTLNDDHIIGTDGNDTLLGMGGADKLFGGTGNDTILGDTGIDALHGESGDDVLKGGSEGEKNTFDQSDYDAGHVLDFEPGIDVLE